jgi:RHS repeat-associated protein
LAAEYVTVAQSADCTTCYLITDPLGSTRVITDGNGNPVSRHDYYPFGEELATSNRTSALQYGATDYVAQRFTGKERDSETGLDFFGERYFSSAQGRFTSPDSMLAKREWLADPQRWNKYAYVRNNPLRYVDPNGEDLVVYFFYGQDLTDEQKKYLQANMKQIQAAITDKFKKAGVDKVDFRDGSNLTQKQIDKILQNGRTTDTTGIGLLNFVNKSYSGYTASDSDIKGVTATDTRSAVFLGNLQTGLNLQDPNGANTMDFRLGEVGAHELGHGQSFESDGATWNFMKSIFGQGNLMGEGQGTPTRPKQFDPSQDKTQRAIKEINRIGDNTPPKQ